MAEKRYSIVRVDNKCPLNVEDSFYCFEYLRKDKCKKCKEIRGDTKEQLISKVEQIIRRPIQKGDLELKSKGFKYGVRRLAKEIVEFWGVE